MDIDTTSLWHIISKRTQSYPSLSEDIEVDVAIIGAGITGLTTAVKLMQEGKRIAILEAHQVGGVTTGSSTGNLYVGVQPYYQHIIEKFDFDTAKIIAKSRAFAIDFIEQTVKEKNIACNFSRRPWFLYTNDDTKIKILENEVEALKKMGFNIDYTKQLPLPFKFKKAAVLDNQARFNPLQYVIDLATDVKKRGGWIFENTRIVKMSEKKICKLVTANGHQVTAKQIMMATHTPIGVNTTQLFTAPYRSYVLAIYLNNNQYPEGHFWDLDCPHHATCTHAISGEKPDILMVAGSHHKVGQDKNTFSNYHALDKFLKEHFSIKEIAYQWSAQHYQSADDVPYIGLASRFAQRTYMATGYFADGLVYGTIAGLLITDMLSAKKNAWTKVYHANRFPLRASAGFLAKEDTNYFLQYYKDFPQKSVSNFSDMKTDSARVVDMNREKWGVYKDKDGKLHIVSAVCSHMKCIVEWNDAEKSWDCPCHGSRFTIAGDVIEGPAKINLKKREL